MNFCSCCWPLHFLSYLFKRLWKSGCVTCGKMSLFCKSSFVMEYALSGWACEKSIKPIKACIDFCIHSWLFLFIKSTVWQWPTCWLGNLYVRVDNNNNNKDNTTVTDLSGRVTAVFLTCCFALEVFESNFILLRSFVYETFQLYLFFPEHTPQYFNHFTNSIMLGEKRYWDEYLLSISNILRNILANTRIGRLQHYSRVFPGPQITVLLNC